MANSIIFVIIILIIYLSYVTFNKYKDRYLALKPQTEKYDYVLPRYYEDTYWIKKYPHLNFYIYNRGPSLSINLDNVKVIELPNKGRDCHTILYHIINNYDRLSEVTIFGGNNGIDKRRYDKVYKTIELAYKTGNTVFLCESNIREHTEFKIDFYKSSNFNNLKHEEDKDKKMILAPIRPFINWYNSNWSTNEVTWICFMCIFAVHRDNILQYPKSYYELLIQGLDNVNTELCHYMERAFTTVFYPYPKSCVYKW